MLLAAAGRALGVGTFAWRWRAVERTIVVAAAGGQGIVLRFDAAAGAPTVSAIHLRRLTP